MLPTGPVSAWPKERNDELHRMAKEHAQSTGEVRATVGEMARGMVGAAGQALRHGRTSPEIREERMETCRNCPFFNPDSKRCTECGCFMEAKSWIGGNPDHLCPKQKWVR